MTRIKDIESKRLGDGDASQNRRGKSEVTIKRDDIGCSCGRCKRRRLARMFFPQELVFNILLRLPAQIIYDVMRHVCREWKDMIHNRDFIYHHLMQSTTGLIIRGFGLRYPTIFIAMGQSGIEISTIGYTFPGWAQSSCNGLVLVLGRNVLYIVNPITKKQITLPPFFKPFFYFHKSCLAYAVASMEYKVVVAYDCDGTKNFSCAILTIGVDQVWRHIDTSHLSLTTRRRLQGSPLVAGWFVNWIAENFVLSLNVETETIYQSPIPFGNTENYYFLGMGSKISSVGPCNEFLWDVWEMKPESGEWTKLFDIDFEAQRCTLERFYCIHEYSLWPVGWLKAREVLLFRVSYRSTLCIAYDVKTQEIYSVDLGISAECSAHHIYVDGLIHVNSLVWFGC